MGNYSRITPTGRYSKAKDCSVGVISGTIDQATNKLSNIKIKFFDGTTSHMLEISASEFEAMVDFWNKER